MNDILSDIDNELDVVFGEYRDVDAVDNFVSAIREKKLKGTLYIGYPVLTVDDEKIEYDALLVSRDRGVVVFDLYSYTGDLNHVDEISEPISQKQEQLYAALFNRLNSFSELRSGRHLAVAITTVSIHPIADCLIQDEDSNLIGLQKLDSIEVIGENDRLPDVKIEFLNAAIQRISNLKPKKKRDNVTLPNSKGAKIKEIEKQVANLDLWQKRGAIEYVNGPQRIRGLAGSGKTVVLALKAAYLHVKRPDWKIAITFNTRSLYQQFESLVTRFVYSQINEEPDWERIQILHAWGASDKGGLYREFVAKVGCSYRDFGTAARLFGYDNAFEGACAEALKETGDQAPEIYDMVLIDEAQDLPASFFSIVYKMVGEPKRIVWAYDDLQNLSDTKLPSPTELFGVGGDGKPLVTLTNVNDKPQQDIVLPRCYRNPPWTLLTAHGLGFGVHREPMANMFQDIRIWKRLGYSSQDNEIEYDKDVSLVRSTESMPSFFSNLLTPDTSLKFYKFDDKGLQYKWIAEEINRLIEGDELQHSDFLIILPNVRTNKKESASIAKALLTNGLQCHIPGQTSSRDEIFKENSIAITHIHRAKGNEAPVVFIANTDYCENPYQIKSRRNIMFTAMTRSRAWTYVLGVGESMDKMYAEFERIKNDDYSLKFHYPNTEQAKELAVSMDEMDDSEDSMDDFDDLRAALAKAKAKGGQLPLDLQEEIRNIHGEGK